MSGPVGQVRQGDANSAAVGGGYQQINATPDAFGAGAGAALQQAGAVVGKVAETADRAAIRIATEDNEATAKAADVNFNTTLRGTLFDPEKGYLNLKGKDATDAYKTTMEGLQKARDDAAGAIKSPEARRMFSDIAQRRQDAALDTMAKHAAIERRTFLDGASIARATDAGSDAVAYATDAAKREAFLNVGRSEIITFGRDHGEPPEVTQSKLRNYDTKAYVDITKKMAVDDPMGAKAFYETNRHKIDGQQQGPIESMLKEATGRRQASNDANEVMGTASSAGATALHGAIVGHESGGRQTDATGKTLTSSKGALGAGQIMPDTFARFANPGEKIDNKDDNLAVSKRMLDKFMVDYNGDWQRAAVAYFSGEGNVAPAGSAKPWKTNSNDGNNTVEQYVANVGKRLGKAPQTTGDPALDAVNAAAGVAPAPVVKTSTDAKAVARDMEANLANYIERAKTLYADNPERLDKALTEIKQRYATQELAVAAQTKADTTAAWQIAVTPNAAGAKPTSQDAIPPDLWIKLDPLQQRALEAQFVHNAKGTQPPPNPSLYAELSRQAVDDPAAFKNRDLVLDATKLPDSDFKHFQDMQLMMGKRDATAEAKMATLQKGLQISDALLKSSGIYMEFADKKGKVKDAKAFDDYKAQYQTALLKEMSQFQADNKKAPNDEEIKKIADRLLMQGRLRGDNWFSDDKAVQFQNPGSFYVPYKEIPADRKAQMEEILAKRGMLPAGAGNAGSNDRKKAVEKAYTLWLAGGGK